jgi:hypothetical protein
VDKTSGQPIRAGFVVLLSDTTTEHARAMTDANGRFTLTAPSTGEYRMRSAVIGIQSTITPPFELRAGQELRVVFEIQAIVVTLPTVVIEDERTCRGTQDASFAAATLWDEVRKALRAVAWTEQQGILRHSLVKYERQLEPTSLEVRASDTEFETSVYRGSPFPALEARELSERGYIQLDDDGTLHYYAPDANVLLSNEFARVHCFSVVRGEDDQAGLLGLAFEPIQGRATADIHGVLWVDAESAELRYLEYNYSMVPGGVRPDHIGGRVEFERLPIGPWIVRRWWIRMPIVGVRDARFSDFVRENYIAAVKEDGGWVSQIHTLDGRPVGRGGVATLSGSVINLRTAEPLRGARIVLVGTEYEASTDPEGRFRFDNVPEGRYRVTFGRELLDAMGYVPPLVEVDLTIDRPEHVALVILPIRRLWSTLCPRSEPKGGVGIVSGFVTDEQTGDAVPDAQILLSRPIAEGGQSEILVDVMTNWAGYYFICDAPAKDALVVEARRAGPSGVVSATANMRLSGGDILRADFALGSVERR